MSQITAGIKLSYGVETTAGTKPSTFVDINGITEIPEIGAAPETYEDTTLDNLEYKTYIDGLKDTGGALAFTANDSPAFRTQITTLISAQKTAMNSGKKVWFRIKVPAPISQSMYFTGKATPLGFGGAGINAVLTTTLYVTPTGEPKWEADGE